MCVPTGVEWSVRLIIAVVMSSPVVTPSHPPDNVPTVGGVKGRVLDGCREEWEEEEGGKITEE